jgi:hypothetical protein
LQLIEASVVPNARLCQGDVLRNVPFIERFLEQEGEIEVSTVDFPLVIVLSQDCDLEHDANHRISERPTQDKWLLSVLAAPIYNAEHVYRGEHLNELERTMRVIKKSSTTANHIRNNEIPRYHFLEFGPGLNLPASIVDFKHYFSLPVEQAHQLRRTQYVASISPLFRESASQRFSNYLARVGLPEAIRPEEAEALGQ